MSSRCSSENCENGNCEGCKDGELFCNDPRCYPDCPDCDTQVKTRSGDWIIALIILILVGVLLVFFIILGFDYWNKRKSAAKPKNISFTKTVRAPTQTVGVSTPDCPPSKFMLGECPSTKVASSVSLDPQMADSFISGFE